MDILEIMEHFYQYHYTRRRGHTHAVIHGVKATPNARVIVSHGIIRGKYAKQNGLPSERCVSMDMVSMMLRGYSGPIVWDNSAIEDLLRRAGTEIHMLRKEVELLEGMKECSEVTIKHYQDKQYQPMRAATAAAQPPPYVPSNVSINMPDPERYIEEFMNDKNK